VRSNWEPPVGAPAGALAPAAALAAWFAFSALAAATTWLRAFARLPSGYAARYLSAASRAPAF
jgi:hypothetical protein